MHSLFPHTKICGSNSNFRDIINLDKARGNSNWLDRWMEESLWSNRRDSSLRNVHADDEKGDKILEVDTWKPHLNSQQSNRTFQTAPHVFASDYIKESFMTCNSPSKHSTRAPNPIPSQATPASGGVLQQVVTSNNVIDFFFFFSFFFFGFWFTQKEACKESVTMVNRLLEVW
jgi:hypothetical protein